MRDSSKVTDSSKEAVVSRGEAVLRDEKDTACAVERMED
jgi:hypothetical protein